MKFSEQDAFNLTTRIPKVWFSYGLFKMNTMYFHTWDYDLNHKPSIWVCIVDQA